MIEYDIPNIERGLDNLKYIHDTNSIISQYLQRRTLDQHVGCWAEMSMERIKNLPDFKYRDSFSQTRALSYKDMSRIRIDLTNPMSHIDLIQNWRSGMRTPSTLSSAPLSRASSLRA